MKRSYFQTFINSRISRIIWATGSQLILKEFNSKVAALCFFSLSSIVPVLAILFGIAKLFYLDKELEADILSRFDEQQEALGLAIKFGRTLLETHSGWIAGTGTIFLIWTTLNLFTEIELALNSIWRVANPRSFHHRVFAYLITIVLLPAIFVGSTSLALLIFTKIGEIFHSNLLGLTQYLLNWILFTALYYLMPNTRVPFKAALIGGVLAGTAYQLIQMLYFQTQFFISSYGAVYGSFAFIPLFLVWLQMSWMIVLVGAQLAHSIQIIPK